MLRYLMCALLAAGLGLHGSAGPAWAGVDIELPSGSGSGDMLKATYDVADDGASDTANALAANGANCEAGQAPLGVDASGAVEGCWSPATGSVETDAIFDAAGDLVQGTGANTSARLAIGADNTILKSTGTAAEWSNTLDIATLDMTSSTSSIPWVMGTGAAPTTEGHAYHNTTTDVTTIGNGTSADRLLTAQGIGVSKVGVITKAADYTLGTDSADEAYGYLVTMTATGTVTLPAVVIGMSVCVYSATAAAVYVDANASDRIILNGLALADGDKLTSASGAGDFICLVGESADGWLTLGRSGTWTDGN